MWTKKTIWLMLGLVGVVILALVAAVALRPSLWPAQWPTLWAVGSGHQEPADRAIRVGVILNLTGALAQADTPKLQVLEAALAYLKGQAPADDPIQRLTLAVEDGKTDPKSGLTAYRKLAADGVRIYITGSSFNAMSLFPLTEEARDLLFGVSGHPDFGKGGSLSYRMYPMVKTGVAHMRKILEAQGDPSVYVFHTDEPFGKSYASTLTAAYPHVVAEEPFQVTQADFKDAVAKLQASGAGRVVVIGFGIGERNLLRQMLERGIDIPAVGSEVFYYAALGLPELADAPGAKTFFANTKFLGPTLLNAILSHTGDRFVDFYKARSGGSPPQLFGVFAADSLILLHDALQRTGGDADPGALSRVLNQVQDVQLFSGQARLLPTRELDYQLGYFGLDAAGHAIPVAAPTK